MRSIGAAIQIRVINWHLICEIHNAKSVSLSSLLKYDGNFLCIVFERHQMAKFINLNWFSRWKSQNWMFRRLNKTTRVNVFYSFGWALIFASLTMIPIIRLTKYFQLTKYLNGRALSINCAMCHFDDAIPSISHFAFSSMMNENHKFLHSRPSMPLIVSSIYLD